MRILSLETIGGYWKKGYSTLLDFLFPLSLFEKRLSKLSPSSFMKRAGPSPLFPEGSSALFSYKNPFVRRTILVLKYRGSLDAARLFGTCLYDFILEEATDLSLFEKKEKPLLVPIPLSKNRLRSRGYNQVELVTRTIEKLDRGSAFTHEPHALVRSKDTQSQTQTTNRSERIKNIAGAFRATTHLVTGKTIFLIDDVITTGTTMKEARKALKEAGAKRIYSYALAH